ncbi:carbohydrate ABC transporter substrate-binding protein [Alginatibacterium sediminis]|uniref:Carbohydrate ABC transporter substrate-binding protein n=1 Tax=Alginatibacterium sediminis TaxID=2164068 RepID=A0A420EB46_9ALTE|nr:ABC transporter substrate-binding protein [Alginatibacterium sediminis]RKF17905.1 carbohydrate ABC transporter substrate-binding protein [Alginatibacterium sediminis]
MKTKKRVLSSLVFAASIFGAHAADPQVTFLNWVTAEPSNQPIVQGLIDQTGVQADVLSSSWGDMQKNVFLRVRTKQELDVFQSSAKWLPTFAQLPNLVDFNEVYGQEYLESLISPAVLASGRYKGKQYGMPWNTGSISLVSNTKVLQQAGIENSPTTIDEFVETLKAVKTAQPESTPYAMMTKGNNLISSDFQLWLWAHGGKIFDENDKLSVNSKATIDTLNFMKNLVDEDLASLDVDRGAARRMFGQGNTAFYFDAPVARGFARDFSGEGEKYDAYVVPVQTPVLSEEMTSHSMEWGHLLIMLKTPNSTVDGSLSKESLSAKFVAGLTMNDSVQLDYFTNSGAIPVTQSARNNPLVTQEKYIVDWNESLGLPLRNELSVLKNSSNYIAVVSEETQSVILGKKTAEEAAAEMEKRIQRLLK